MQIPHFWNPAIILTGVIDSGQAAATSLAMTSVVITRPEFSWLYTSYRPCNNVISVICTLPHRVRELYPAFCDETKSVDAGAAPTLQPTRCLQNMGRVCRKAKHVHIIMCEECPSSISRRVGLGRLFSNFGLFFSSLCSYILPIFLSNVPIFLKKCLYDR